MVGNERRGLSYECARLATDKVQVPMVSHRINCLNVAAASAVALYYLCGTRVGPMATRGRPGQPASRSAVAESRGPRGTGKRHPLHCCLWLWPGADRRPRRRCGLAARSRRALRRPGGSRARGRNEILCVPCPSGASHGFARVTVVTTHPIGFPLHRVNLARGPGQLIVLADERSVDQASETWSRLGKEVEFCAPANPRQGI